MTWLCIMSSFVLNASEGKTTQFHIITLPYEANVVEHVLQDQQGMMWFATRRGLFSYDGYHTRRLAEGHFYAIIKIDEETFCIGGEAGLRWFNLKTEQFITPYGDTPETGEVRSLALHRGMLYVGTKQQGLFCLDMKNHLWQRYTLPDGQNDIIFSFETVGDDIYIAHYTGMAYLDAKGRIHDARVKDNVYDIWYDTTKHHLWIGTEHHLLCRHMDSGVTDIIASGSTFNQIVPSNDGHILLATEFGLRILDPQSGNMQTIAHDASSPQNSLPSNTIHQIYCTNKGIWVATDRGVAFTQLRDVFEITHLPSITHSNDGNVLRHILTDSNGGQWLGGDNGMIHITAGATRWFKVGNGLKKSTIRRIYEDRDRQIWIATDAGIAWYNPQRDAFRYFTVKDQRGRNANWAYDIYEDAKGRLWIATYMGGLYVVDKQALLASDGSVTMSGQPFAQVDNLVSTISSFTPDSHGVLWANSSKGLVSINTNTMEVKQHLNMSIDNLIWTAGSVWIDIQGKLYRYDTSTNRLEDCRFEVRDGMIYAFVRENKHVWFSTSEGLYYIDTTDNSTHPYCKQDIPLMGGCYLPSEKAILWGGDDIICKQQMTSKVISVSHRPIYLSTVMADGQDIHSYVPRFENIISLNARNDIVLGLATFAYDINHSEVFSYKIGSKGEWHTLPNGSNHIMLPYLSGGEHELYLSCHADHPKEEITRYILEVPYPWYQQWWAWILYLVCTASVIYSISFFYKQREKKVYEQRERERIMTLTQQKMDFFVDMSHELKTPLSLIVAPLEKLLSETTNARLRDRLKSIQKNAMRLNDLIHHILDYKQLEFEGDSQVLYSQADLHALISSCMEEFTSVASERHIGMSLDADTSPIVMEVDVVKVQMIMRNLLSNAFKYVKEDSGKIAIQVRTASSFVSVTVSDNGPGVAESDLQGLFNRYYMGQNAHEGSGIGLSVVKKYVELHGGEVSAANHHGLTVTFTLPINQYTETEERDNTLNITDKKHILIVDDNHEMRDFLTTALSPSYHCITASQGEEAMRLMEQQVPDIIITDQMMPGIDGTELCHRIRQNHATSLTPIIMLTARDDTDTELRSIRSGADVFMPKPFDLRKLQLHIVQLLNKRRAIEQNTRIEQMSERQEEAHVLSTDEQLMERIITLIHDNMHSEEFNVTKLCDMLCIDQKQLYRKLKLMTGETPVSFIRKQRMKRAAILLKQDRFTVSEVMYQVGYSSASYFTKSFTKEYGISPKDYAGKT